MRLPSSPLLRVARLLPLLSLLAAGACATPPTEPGVLALPGTGKSLEQFNADDLDCRKRAGTAPGAASSGSWSDQQRRYDYAYIQCMYVKGHRVPVAGQFTGAPAAGPPPAGPPPGTPPPPPEKPGAPPPQ